MKNLLYIGNPTSIHDIKWASFFAKQKEQYTVYFITEKEVCTNIHGLAKELNKNNIHLLDSIDSFSLSKPSSTLNSVRQVKKIIKEYHIDVMHILFSAPFSLWAIFIDIPTIITNRGSDILLEIPKLLTKGLKGRLFFSLFTKAFNKSTVTATSQKQIDKIEDLFHKKAVLIRTGVDVNKIQNITSTLKREKVIFSPRYFKSIYNIELQIEAIKYLPLSIIKDYTFLFIKGKNPDLKYAEKLEAELLLLKQKKELTYQVIESLGQEEMFKQYGKSALTIMTPHSDGTPNSALEAMSAKCPLIVPNLDYDASLFDNTCKILLENNAKDLAQFIQESLDHYDNKFIENAFNAVSKYGNREVEMKKLEAIYERF